MIIIFCACYFLSIIILMIHNGFIVFGSIFGILLIFGLFSFRSIYYVLTEKEIHIYWWGVRGKPNYRICILGIISAERSYFNNGTASMKTIRFRYKENHKRYHIKHWGLGTPLISPVREQEFLETLKTINPNIQINVTDKKGWWWRFWGWDI